jgi:beta-galactosidase
VTLRFLEPYGSTQIGHHIFEVSAQDEVKLANFDILQAAGGNYRTVVTRTFPAVVTDGHLKLDFRPIRGEAFVSNITIKGQPFLAPTGKEP